VLKLIFFILDIRFAAQYAAHSIQLAVAAALLAPYLRPCPAAQFSMAV
jgi:hypothetical protein